MEIPEVYVWAKDVEIGECEDVLSLWYVLLVVQSPAAHSFVMIVMIAANGRMTCDASVEVAASSCRDL